MYWDLKRQKECNMSVVIISGGRLEQSALPFLKEKQAVIAVDGGLEFCYHNHISVDYVVGDFDTIKLDILAYYQKEGKAQIKAYEPEKDMTDTKAALELAVRLAKEKRGLLNQKETTKDTEIILLGGIGSRMDHTMANIGCIRYALEQDVSMKVIDGNNCIYGYNHSFVIEKKELVYHKYLSLMALGGEVKNLSIRGLKYEVENVKLPVLSDWGVSNELLEERAEITFSEGILLVIESRD